jgi:hypothetical protein
MQLYNLLLDCYGSMPRYKLQLCWGYETMVNSNETDILLRIDLSTNDTVLDLLNQFAVDRIRK